MSHKTFIFSEIFANLSSALWFLQSYRKAALISKQCSGSLRSESAAFNLFVKVVLRFLAWHTLHENTWRLACVLLNAAVTIHVAHKHKTTLHLSFCSTVQIVRLITYITGLLTYN